MAQGNNQLQVNVVANVRAAQVAINKLAAKPVNLTINSKQFSQPLGRIQGQLGEFEKSLEASNARVIAFGASASAIYAVQKALSESVKSAIEVEKALTDINVILNLTDKSLAQFGTSLFDIAKNTGNAFSTVATAATELSRQGLGVAETLKRTQDALILTRLSGLGAADSVEAITATLNGFQKAALSSTDVINKLAAVDANFAVSSGDLAEAIKRVGSSAEDAGVSFDQLLAIVTSAQQITARGGSVIGNSFKTIFTRLQRPKVLEDLQQLGIETQTAEGNTRPLIEILSNLAKTFDTLNDSQKAAIAEQVGGVFQINILKAALGDLNKEYSIFSNALKTSTGATDEAIRRNEALNTTLASLINKTLANLTAAGAKIGELSLAPALKKVFGGLNTVLENFGGGESEDFGSKIGEGLLKGIGNFLSGPGIIIATKALFSIFERLTTFSADAVKTLLGLNVQATQQAQIQQQINTLLSQNPAIIAQIVSGQATLQDIQDNILNTIKAQTLAMEQQVTVSKALAASLGAAGVSIGTTGAMKGRLQAKAGGYMPDAFKQEEASARNLGAVNPKAQFSKGTIGGEKFIKNNKEIEIPNFGKNGDSAVIPTYGSVGDKKQKEYYDKLKFLGFVPNFAQTKEQLIATMNNPNAKPAARSAAARELGMPTGFAKPTGAKTPLKTIPAGNVTVLSSYGDRSSRDINYIGEDGTRIRFTGIKSAVPQALLPSDENNFDSIIERHLPDAIRGMANDLLGNKGKGFPDNNAIFNAMTADKSAYPQIAGRIFETVISSAINKNLGVGEQGNRTWDYSPADFNDKQIVDALFGSDASKLKNTYIDAKRSPVGEGSTNEKLKSKLFTTFGSQIKTAEAMSRGYIPNFAGIKTAMQAEKKMGGNPALDFQQGVGLYVRDKNTQSNFSAVKRDHPEGISQAMKNSQKAQESLARGFIPNFAPTTMSNIGGGLKKAFDDKGIPEGMKKLKDNIFGASFAFSTLSGVVETFNKDSKNTFAMATSEILKGASTFTSIASVIPGQVGLIVGAVAGLNQAIEGITKSIEDAPINRIIDNSKLSAENFSKLSDSTQKYAVTFQKLQEIYKSDKSFKDVQKGEKDLYQALLEVPPKYRTQLASAKNLTEIQDVIAKTLETEAKNKKQIETAAAIGTNVKEANRSGGIGGVWDYLGITGEQIQSGFMGQGFSGITSTQLAGGVYTSKGQDAERYAKRDAERIVGGLSKDFFDAIANKTIDLNQKGGDFIKTLSKFGLTLDEEEVLMKMLNNERGAGVVNFDLLAQQIKTLGLQANDTKRKLAEGQKNREAGQAAEAEEAKQKRRLIAETENAATISEMYANALIKTALQEKNLINVKRSANAEIIAEASKSRLQTAQPFMSEINTARSQYQIEAFQRKSNLQTKQSDIVSKGLEDMSGSVADSIQSEIEKLKKENAPKARIQELQIQKGQISNIINSGGSPQEISKGLQDLTQKLNLDDQAVLAQKSNEILANIQNDQQNALVEYQKGNVIAQEQLSAQLTQIQDQQKLKVAGGIQGFLDPTSFETTLDNFTKNLNAYRNAGSTIQKGRGATGLLSDTLNFAGGGFPIGTGGGLGKLRSEAIAGRAADIRNQARTLGEQAPIGLKSVFRNISANASDIAAKQIDNLIKDQNIGDNVDKIATTLDQIQASLTPNLGPTSNATQSFVNQRNSTAMNVASALQPLKGSVDLNIPNNLLALNVNGKISVEGGGVEVTLSPDSDLTTLVTPIVNNFIDIAKQDIKNEFNNRILKIREEAGLRREATAV
jgi:TP901 family phage tail tape measure protein